MANRVQTFETLHVLPVDQCNLSSDLQPIFCSITGVARRFDSTPPTMTNDDAVADDQADDRQC